MRLLVIILIIDLYKAEEKRKLYCPCKNEGTCLKSHTYAYKCQCQEGYYGTYCQFFNISYKFVDNPTCKNGGVRTQLSGLCSCLPGFYGSQCEYQPYALEYITTTKARVNSEPLTTKEIIMGGIFSISPMIICGLLYFLCHHCYLFASNKRAREIETIDNINEPLSNQNESLPEQAEIHQEARYQEELQNETVNDNEVPEDLPERYDDYELNTLPAISFEASPPPYEEAVQKIKR